MSGSTIEPRDGVLVVDKPPGPTSHDMVYRVRRLTGAKVGHAGTLDPAATGVLPLLLGRASRLSRFLTDSSKEYLAVIRFGLTTNSDDLEGEVLERHPVPRLSVPEIEDVLGYFRGTIEQIPPMFSAIKIKGERLYRAARRGETIDRPPRSVTIHQLELLDSNDDQWKLRVGCSSGTYVRSLARDLGDRLGCGAVLAELRRVRAGQFTLDDAVPSDRLETDWRDRVVPLEHLLPEVPMVELDAAAFRSVVHGNSIPAIAKDREHAFDQVRLFREGCLVAIARTQGDRLRPMIVFAEPQ